ncbi:MAG: hypothetical protein DRQ88_06610 [Epsilonproteobacteria bacterium]|nr:MAG: hypothetical protein DRQ89_11395 [Campylobacterota bacterium]RLA66385.1 MAG: hypothetical protein DRQ88_06610 [Campylobacterota bacterium]
MINALVYTEELEQKGFSAEQAKAAVKIWLELMNSEFATKSDLNSGFTKMSAEFKADISEVKAELKADVSEVKAEFKADISEVKLDISEVKAELKSVEFKLEKKIDGLESKLIIKLGSLMVIGIGVIATMIKFGQ